MKPKTRGDSILFRPETTGLVPAIDRHAAVARRSRNQMMQILLEEALEARDGSLPPSVVTDPTPGLFDAGE